MRGVLLAPRRRPGSPFPSSRLGRHPPAPAPLRTLRTAQVGHFPHEHVALTITRMEDDVRGAHLRRQRQIAGFSIKALANGAGVSPTRIRQIEATGHVTPRAITRYLDGIAQAWRSRAEDAAREEVTS